MVRDLAPDIVILEIGTNNLTHTSPETVGSNIEDFASFLKREFSVCANGICGVIPSGISVSHVMSFWHNASVLNQYVGVVLDDFANVFCWSQSEFNSPHKDLHLRDGVHVNPPGQYLLYQSYRGAILMALGLLGAN